MNHVYKSTDSITAKLSKAALYKNRAATATKVKLNTTFSALEKAARAGRWGKVCPASLTFSQFKNYIHSRIEEGIGARSIQNEASHIRRALVGVGREEFAQITCSSKKLGVPSASRTGTGKVVNPDVLTAALDMAPPDTRALILLQRQLGLRAREAVMSAESLKAWEKALTRGGQPEILIGTKGGRARTVYIRPDNLESVLVAVRSALAVMKDGREHLIRAVSLKSALEQYGDRLARVGLSEKNSSHSLRRGFACDQYQYYLNAGYSEKFALARLSNDLGHGDGRGRWVFNNYLRASLEAYRL